MDVNSLQEKMSHGAATYFGKVRGPGYGSNADTPMVGGFVLGAAANLLNMKMQSDANAANLANQNMLWNKQMRYQKDLNANGMLEHRRALARAGFNPNYEYGPAQNLTAQTPQMASLQAPHLDVASLLQSQLIDAQRKNIEADTELKNKQGNVAEADSVLKQAQAWSLDQLTPAQRKEIEVHTGEMVQKIENLKVEQDLTLATIGKTMAETEGQELQNYLTKESTPLILKQYATNIALMHSQMKLNSAQTAAAYKSLSVMSAQINALNSQAHLNSVQAHYVANAAVGLAIDNDYKRYRNTFKSDFVHNELKLTDAQIKQIESAGEQMRVNTEFAPLTAISGALGGIGVAVGGLATGLNQGKQFFNSGQSPALPWSFNTTK